MNPIRRLDNFLNAVTMYKVLLYGLSAIAVLCLVLSATGALTVPFGGLVLSLLLVMIGCGLTNFVLAKIWELPANQESWFISALILFFIVPQATTGSQAILIFLAAVIAMASKFIIVLRGAHLFNPAAFGVAVLGIFGLLSATWWIGSSILWPFTLLFGLLVIRKIRRGTLAVVFALVAIFLSYVLAVHGHQNISQTMSQALTASPLIFLGSIMLTEPSTMPGRRRQQLIFAAVVAILYTTHFQVAKVYISPELALVLGNLFVAIFWLKTHTKLTLKTINRVSDRVYDYVFTPERRLAFQAGQYMEWTLPGVKFNNRGNRRTFTIASSPTENEVHLGVKFSEPSSVYKQVLKQLKPGGALFAGEIAGNFTLPADNATKLVFIAGGVGITPFRSIIKSIVDSKQQRDAVLIYLLSDPAEAMYADVFKAAQTNGLKVVLLPSSRTALNAKVLKGHIPDCQDRLCYVSGPPPMVQNAAYILRQLGVSQSHIITDSFTGY